MALTKRMMSPWLLADGRLRNGEVGQVAQERLERLHFLHVPVRRREPADGVAIPPELGQVIVVGGYRLPGTVRAVAGHRGQPDVDRRPAVGDLAQRMGD